MNVILLSPGFPGEMPFFAVARHGFDEISLPMRREREYRQHAFRRGVGGAKLAREPLAHMLGDLPGRPPAACRFGNAFEDSAEIAD